ncbi:MAG: IclR family transcriptional regulator C-terminal domain-containing protein [Comamonadaceae bacterium]|nr:IclR family transcriptional regulator C-terminal domain-containing protein [Comamonadaceae bacterium]
MSNTDTYPRVRALERGLELLAALSDLGWSSPGELTKRTGINRATTYRLLFTLEQSGYIYRRPGDGRFFLTKKIQQLSDGVKDEDQIVQVIGPHMGRLLAQVQWPSDFATFTAGRLEIKESTHRFSPLSVHRAMVGKTRPLLHSALGVAILSAVSDASMQQMLAVADVLGHDDASRAQQLHALMHRQLQARERGYADSTGGTDPNISAIACPVCWRNRVLGAINIMFFRRVMTTDKAAERYLGALRQCVQDIERELDTLILGEYGWPRHSMEKEAQPWPAKPTGGALSAN